MSACNKIAETTMNDSIEEDYEDNSDDNLKIVIESPQRKKTILPEPTKSEKMIIESIEDELERRLEEKAAKTNLNATHVKNIIRHVVTNEHVLALVKKAENPNAYDESVPYEPKLTRAKAKELLSSVPIPSVPWATPKQTSEVQVLFSEDLQEDSSGDEYIPGEDESEDDPDGSIISDPPSVPPATPPTFAPSNNHSSTQTNWTEDGVFKIPGSVRSEDTEEDTNIARRTRSKLCLSSTPLEVIEEAFIPPDITTDMYDMDCDNDDWMDFLKKFTRPLDEIARATDDEELDPEYNILADEEIDEVDKEELRVDKAVKVTRKELNDLIAELFECTDIAAINDEIDADKNSKESNNKQPTTETVDADETLNKSNNKTGSLTVVIDESNEIDEEKCTDILIKKSQIPLLEQQMTQHVQLLTQNFLLSYGHPEIHSLALQSKEYLLNLKFLYENKQRSMFYTINLTQALDLIKHWEDLVASNTEEVSQMKRHIEKTMAESFHRRQSGNIDIPLFPKLILDTISKSEVFLYPSLLPKIPFKPPSVFSKGIVSYTNAEDHLIALGLEQFVPMVKQQQRTFSLHGEISMKIVCSHIQECMMPHKDAYKINNHIQKSKLPRCANNPIKYYFQNNRAPPTTHYVYPINQLQVLPPCKRSPNELPYQWKRFNYPSQTQSGSVSVTKIVKPEVYNTPLNVVKPLFPNSAVTLTPVFSTPIRASIRRPYRRKPRSERFRRYNIIKVKNDLDPISKFVECLSRPSQVSKLLSLYPTAKSTVNRSIEDKENSIDSLATYKSFVSNIMLPNMPSIGTPVKNHPQSEVSSSTSSDNINPDITSTNSECGTPKGESRRSTHHEFSTISSTSFQQPDTSTEVEFCNPTDSVQTITSTCNVNSEASTSFQNLGSTSGQGQARSNTGATKVQSKLRQDTMKENSEKDNPDDINALFIASSTLKPTVRKEPSGAEKKRAKLKREFLANLAISTPEDPEVEKQKNEMFALAYYDKMRESLDLEDYHKIMQILNDHEEGDAVDLYKKVEKVLNPKYQELADEFLLFLREKEAAAVGQLVPWIRMNNRSKFLRKLEIYFKDQPSQLRKIYKCLTELAQTVDVSMEKIKTTLVPMFKGNAVLSDLFLQSFLEEGPPPSLLEGPYETIDITKEMSRPDDEEIVETITVPDVEDKYGSSSCICNCHQIEDPEFKSRYRHCIRCGTKFMNGKVYVQTGRGLRPATVTFLTNPDTDHNLRLIGKTPPTTSQRKKRSDNSPSKQVTSPTKENPDEESDDEVDGKKKKKTTKRKRPSKKSLKNSKESRKSTVTKKNVTGKCDSTKFSSASPTRKDYKSSNRKRTYSSRKSKGKVVEKSDNTHELEEKELAKLDIGSPPDEEKRSEEEHMEWDTLTGESSVDMKPSSPGHQTAESESEVYEESSQDNCESDSNSSISSINNQSQSDSNTGEECSWKREEDKIILETFQKENDKENAFKIISQVLKDRTVDQISNRFQTLMDLLLETLGTS